MLKGQKGITLIALVVTIIVLIILAGVSISLMFGQYGIVTRAKEASNMQSNAQQEETQYLTNAAHYVNAELTR